MGGEYECRVCSYTYKPSQGDGREFGAGTQFKDLPPGWRCPACRSQKGVFEPITLTIAGFADNQQYGFGALYQRVSDGVMELALTSGLGRGVMMKRSPRRRELWLKDRDRAQRGVAHLRSGRSRRNAALVVRIHCESTANPQWIHCVGCAGPLR